MTVDVRMGTISVSNDDIENLESLNWNRTLNHRINHQPIKIRTSKIFHRKKK